MKKEKNTFEESLKIALLFCNAWDQEELSDEILADKISDLIKTENGARGFFVISLSSDSPLMDRLPDPIVQKLRFGGDLIVDLTVRNLTMSSAMAVTHKRNKQFDQENSSKRIQRRCIELLRLLEPKLVKNRIESLLEGTKGIGKDVIFLKRWGYDNEQIQSIVSAINSIPEN